MCQRQRHVVGGAVPGVPLQTCQLQAKSASTPHPGVFAPSISALERVGPLRDIKMLPLLLPTVLGARAKKVVEAPPPEPSMLPIIIAIVACWVVPFLLMQIMQGAPKAKVGINGFGRIGRLVARAMCKAAGVELVAIVRAAPMPSFHP